MRHGKRVHQRITRNCRESSWATHIRVVKREPVASSEASIHKMAAIKAIQVAVASATPESPIREVHMIKVAAAHAIPWNERLAPAQRTPAEANANSATEPRHHCGR